MNSISHRYPMSVFVCLLATAGLACSLFSQAGEDINSARAETGTAAISGTSPSKPSDSSGTNQGTSTKRTTTLSATEGAVKPRTTITPLVEPTEETGIEIPGKYTWTPSRTPVNTKAVTSSENTGTPSPTGSLTKTPTLIVPTSTTVPACNITLNPDFENDLINQINDARSKLSPPLGALSRSSLLVDAARRHSRDMACTLDWFDQKGSDGSTLYDRIDDTGYSFSAASQNIYEGSGTSNNPESAFNTWINLTTSKANMLNSNYTEIGIGYISNPNSTYEGYFTAVFAAP